MRVEVRCRPRFALTSRLWTAALVRSKKALQFLRTGDKRTAPLANNEPANKRYALRTHLQVTQSEHS